MDWQLLLATLINGVGVMAAVQLIKLYLLPVIKEKYPWALPIIAAVVGPGFAYITESLTTFLGYPIDLSAIVAALSGLAASGAFAVIKEATGRG